MLLQNLETYLNYLIIVIVSNVLFFLTLLLVLIIFKRGQPKKEKLTNKRNIHLNTLNGAQRFMLHVSTVKTLFYFRQNSNTQTLFQISDFVFSSRVSGKNLYRLDSKSL